MTEGWIEGAKTSENKGARKRHTDKNTRAVCTLGVNAICSVSEMEAFIWMEANAQVASASAYTEHSLHFD